jgi:hypothetical protein
VVHLSTPLPSEAPLIHLHDTTTNITYLVDSGTAISLVPHRSLLQPTGPVLLTQMAVSSPLGYLFQNFFILAPTNFTINYFKPMFLSQFLVQISSKKLMQKLISKQAM